MMSPYSPDFSQPIAKVFSTAMSVILEDGSFDRQMVLNSPSFVAFNTNLRPEFKKEKDRWEAELEESQDVFRCFRELRFSNHLTARIADRYTLITGFGTDASRRRDTHGFLLGLVQNLDKALVNLVEKILDNQSAFERFQSAAFLPGEAIFRGFDPFPIKETDVPPQAVWTKHQWELINYLSSLSHGSVYDDYVPELISLPRPGKSKSVPTMALVDILGNKASSELMLNKLGTVGTNTYFVLKQVGVAQDIAQRVDHLLSAMSPMPTIICLPELTVGDTVFEQLGEMLQARIDAKQDVPLLTLVGRTHIPTGENDYHRNEVWGYFLGEELPRISQKRSQFTFANGSGAFIEKIDSDNKFVILDLPGFGRLAVIICLDFLRVDPKLLVGLGVNMVFVPAMTSFRCMEEDFLDQARKLAGLRISTACVNSGFRMEQDNLLGSSFVCPIVRQSKRKQLGDKSQHMRFGDFTVCGAVYSMRSPFRKNKEISGVPITICKFS